LLSRDGRRVINDDNDGWLKPAFAKVYYVLARDRFAVSFYGWRHADKFIAAWRTAAFRVVGHLMFSKRCTSTTRLVRYQHECAYLLAKGDPKPPECTIGDVIAWAYSGNRLHPTQKPLSVLLPLIEAFSVLGGLVLDPFAGSGSTLVAQNNSAATGSASSLTPSIKRSPPHASPMKQTRSRENGAARSAQRNAKANARLIAASPDMVEALELCGGVLAELSRLDDRTPSVSTLNFARTAIAKATGG
jgi:hypothetical protein